MEDNKDKVINDLLKRISNLEFDVEDKQREIENLKQINEEHKKINGELRVENERLNKGLTELDNMFYETFRISQNGYYSISEWELKDFTDKLQELKGEDKNTTC